MQQSEDLKVWERSHALVLSVNRLTRGFPPSEQYGITSQVRRAAVSVAANIAEGAKRATRKDYSRFLNLSEGSLAETQYLLLLARDLGLAVPTTVEPLMAEAEEILRMLSGLRNKVERSA